MYPVRLPLARRNEGLLCPAGVSVAPAPAGGPARRPSIAEKRPESAGSAGKLPLAIPRRISPRPQPPAFTDREGAAPAFLRGCGDARGCARLRQEGCSLRQPGLPRVSRALPAGLNPDCSLPPPAVGGAPGTAPRPPPRGAQAAPPARPRPGSAAVGRSRRDGASPAARPGAPVPPRLTPARREVPPPGTGPVRPARGAAGTAPEAFSGCGEARRGIPWVRCPNAPRPPHGRAGDADSFV